MDPTRPLDVTVRIDSPQVVAYRLFFRRPGDTQGTVFGNGDDQSPNPASFPVGPLPSGSRIRYFMLINGNPQTAYRIVLGVEQGGGEVVPPVQITGTTDGDGTASERGEVTL